MDNKKCLSSAPGIGKKAASQIVLDLADKISKFSDIALKSKTSLSTNNNQQDAFDNMVSDSNQKYLNEAVMAW